MNSSKIVLLTILLSTFLVGCESSSTGEGTESQNAQTSNLSERQKKSLEKELKARNYWFPLELMGAIYRHAPLQIDQALKYLDQTYQIECHEQCLVTKKEIK